MIDIGRIKARKSRVEHEKVTNLALKSPVFSVGKNNSTKMGNIYHKKSDSYILNASIILHTYEYLNNVFFGGDINDFITSIENIVLSYLAPARNNYYVYRYKYLKYYQIMNI